MQMSCLGCNQVVCEMDPGEIMAIACRCGANAPVLVGPDETTMAPPASLIFLAQKEPLHVEYYLGYSEHQSPAKDQLIDILVSHGATWQKDCPEAVCQRAIERHRDREQRRK